MIFSRSIVNIALICLFLNSINASNKGVKRSASAWYKPFKKLMLEHKRDCLKSKLKSSAKTGQWPAEEYIILGSYSGNSIKDSLPDRESCELSNREFGPLAFSGQTNSPCRASNEDSMRYAYFSTSPMESTRVIKYERNLPKSNCFSSCSNPMLDDYSLLIDDTASTHCMLESTPECDTIGNQLSRNDDIAATHCVLESTPECDGIGNQLCRNDDASTHYTLESTPECDRIGNQLSRNDDASTHYTLESTPECDRIGSQLSRNDDIASTYYIQESTPKCDRIGNQPSRNGIEPLTTTQLQNQDELTFENVLPKLPPPQMSDHVTSGSQNHFIVYPGSSKNKMHQQSESQFQQSETSSSHYQQGTLKQMDFQGEPSDEPEVEVCDLKGESTSETNLISGSYSKSGISFRPMDVYPRWMFDYSCVPIVNNLQKLKCKK